MPPARPDSPRPSRSRAVAFRAKRVLDVVGATAGLVALAPLLGATAAGILLVDGRPILFRQKRPGQGGKVFEILKFRTMRPPREAESAHLTDRARVTRLGSFLRRTSLDELPELWNVLRGDMSLVGPRPLLIDYLHVYTPEEARRHEMPAGMTGWAAVNGRHALHFKDRLKLDVWYVDHWSLWLDLKILARTIHQVVRRKNVATTQAIAEIGFPLPTAGRGEAGAAEGPPT